MASDEDERVVVKVRAWSVEMIDFTVEHYR